MFYQSFLTPLLLVYCIPWSLGNNNAELNDENFGHIDTTPIEESFTPISSDNETAFYDFTLDFEGDRLAARQLKPSPKNLKLSNRDKSWLDSHNKRRKKYHTKFKTSYAPLKWSHALKNDAEKWAKKLVSRCTRRGVLAHDPNTNYGENLANGYGKELVSTDSVLERWVEKEQGDKYPSNGHYTQVLWRATEYVGCYDATSIVKNKNRLLRKKGKQKPSKAGKMNKGGKKGKGNGGKGNGGSKPGKDEDSGGSLMCQIQVCRYARPGNCNVGKYNSHKTPMLADESPCGPYCPPGGCK